MPKKKAESKSDPDLKEVQEWNRKIRERMKKAREANQDASNSNQKVRDNS